jgi:transcriptional regulator with XRE-family HTH domain
VTPKGTKALPYLGLALRVARGLAGLSQEEVAQRLRSDPKRLSSYERGLRLPSLEQLGRLIEALGMDLLSFFYVYRCIEDSATGAAEPLVVLSRGASLRSIAGENQAAGIQKLLGGPFDKLERLVRSRVQRQEVVARRERRGADRQPLARGAAARG